MKQKKKKNPSFSSQPLSKGMLLFARIHAREERRGEKTRKRRDSTTREKSSFIWGFRCADGTIRADYVRQQLRIRVFSRDFARVFASQADRDAVYICTAYASGVFQTASPAALPSRKICSMVKINSPTWRAGNNG